MQEFIRIEQSELGQLYGNISKFYAALEKFEACHGKGDQEGACACFEEAFALAPPALKSTTYDRDGQPNRHLNHVLAGLGYTLSEGPSPCP